MITLLIIFIIVISIKEEKKTRQENLNTNYQNSISNTPTLPIKESNIINTNYYKKEYLLTNTEKQFYYIIKNIANKNNLTIFTQVALYELINIKKDNNYYTDFNKISRKTIDFVVTDINTRILLCIELDDYTHNTPKRIDRDIFINNLFKNVNLPLLRIPVNTNYNSERIEKVIKEKIGLE